MNTKVTALLAPIIEAIAACEDFTNAAGEEGNADTDFLGELDDEISAVQLKALARMHALEQMECQVLAERNGARWVRNEMERAFPGERRNK